MPSGLVHGYNRGKSFRKPIMRHPSDVLFPGEKPFPILPAVDHYAGSEKLMRKALQLQRELGPIFDITCDCEDGAHAGAEREHAEMVAALIMSAARKKPFWQGKARISCLWTTKRWWSISPGKSWRRWATGS